ncbi:hypothetical protein SO694_00129068 [Aureococcus anophagefferens]|uniref:SAM domain-containing protein n=1 Tax=Aureococcus anophagefferens TaxID=44056 RepID=A0ABR1G544_AURAN
MQRLAPLESPDKARAPASPEVKALSPLPVEHTAAAPSETAAAPKPQPQTRRDAPTPQPESRGRAHARWSAITVASAVERVCKDLGLVSVAGEFYEHGVTGDVLPLLTLDALREMAHEEDGVKDRHSELTKVGSRLRIREGLAAFVARHGDVDGAALRDGVLGGATFLVPDSSRSPMTLYAEHPSNAASAKFRIACRAVRGLLQAEQAAPALQLIRRKPEQGASRKPKQVFVPVFMTLLIKKLVEVDETSIALVGTLIQRPLVYDLERLKRVGEAEETTRPFFQMRINEGEDDDANLVLRKTVPQFVDGAEAGEAYFASSSTFVAKMPLKLNSIISSHPFHVVSASTLLELTSFTGHLDGADQGRTRERNSKLQSLISRPFSTRADGAPFECRPNLLGHVEDLRNLVSVRDWSTSALDEMRSWNIINTSPCIEYVVDGKHDKGYYCPKVRVTFYLRRAYIQPFIESLMPVVFANIALTLLVMRKTQIDLGDRLGNVVAIGLTIVFVVPQLSSSLSFQPKMQLNHVYVVWIYMALIVVLLYSFGMSKASHFARRQGDVRDCLLVMLWGNLVIPFTNFVRYALFVRLLEREPRAVANPMTFNGRVGEVSEVLSRDPEANTRRLHLRLPKRAAKAPAAAKKVAPGGLAYADELLAGKQSKGKNTAGSAIRFSDLATFFKPPEAGETRVSPNPALLHIPDDAHPNKRHFGLAYAQGDAAPWRFYTATKAITCGLPAFIMSHVPWAELLRISICGSGSTPWYRLPHQSVAILPTVARAVADEAAAVAGGFCSLRRVDSHRAEAKAEAPSGS